MLHPAPFRVDNGATQRIAVRNRARDRKAYAEFEANFEKLSAGLHAWQIALHRNGQFLDAFKEVQ